VKTLLVGSGASGAVWVEPPLVGGKGAVWVEAALVGGVGA